MTAFNFGTKLKQINKASTQIRMNVRKDILCWLFLGVYIFLTPFHSHSQEPVSKIKRVVIDAGHGGKDPGCHGVNTREKDVCLNAALELGKKIKEQYPDIEVIFTRDKDIFIELDERAQIANRNQADLFVSIHANAGPSAAKGAEVYVLGLHRTDAQRQVMERENSVIHLEEDSENKKTSLTADEIILRTLQQAVFLDHSILFATKVTKEFEALGRHNRGVKQAGFLVLYKTTMPSVLIELGFLSNKAEEAFLKNKANREKMAGAIFTAFEKYKKVYERNLSQEISENATKNDDPSDLKEEDIDPEDVVFRVQIATSPQKVDVNDSFFKGLTVFEYNDNDLHKYTSGIFTTFKAANEYKNKLRNEIGFENAFVVAFQGKVRINLQKAIKLAEN